MSDSTNRLPDGNSLSRSNPGEPGSTLKLSINNDGARCPSVTDHPCRLSVSTSPSTPR